MTFRKILTPIPVRMPPAKQLWIGLHPEQDHRFSGDDRIAGQREAKEMSRSGCGGPRCRRNRNSGPIALVLALAAFTAQRLCPCRSGDLPLHAAYDILALRKGPSDLLG